jgi:hypothetical protein
MPFRAPGSQFQRFSRRPTVRGMHRAFEAVGRGPLGGSRAYTADMQREIRGIYLGSDRGSKGGCLKRDN